MDPERWRLVREILGRALEQPADQRDRFIREQSDDDELRAEVEALLREHLAAGSFLERPAWLDAPLPPALEPSRRGERIGRYELSDPVGNGGMGVVYRATERMPEGGQRTVAVKIIRPEIANEELRRRFVRERKVLQALSHPNIAQLLDWGETSDGLPFFVMEYVDGQPLNRYCDDAALPVDERLALLREITHAIQFAHSRNIIHRDLKPSNILVGEDGPPTLLDFGLAKIVSGDTEGDTTIHALTPRYASPEQLRDGPLSAQTDVYSLGVVMHELLCGTAPLPAEAGDRGRRPSEAFDSLRRADPTVESKTAARIAADRSTTPAELGRRLRGDLDEIVCRALAPDPGERYATIEELGADLGRVIDGAPSMARKKARMRRARRRAGVVLFVVTVAATMVLLSRVGRVDRNPGVFSRPELIITDLVTDQGSQHDGRISPDARTIAYVDDRGERSSLIVIDRADASRSELVSSDARITDPTWSPAGDRIAYLAWPAQVPRLMIVDRASGAVATVTPASNGDRLMRWGARGIYALRDGAVWVYRFDAGWQRLTPESLPFVRGFDVALATENLVLSIADGGREHLWTSRIDGSDLEQITRADSRDFSPRWLDRQGSTAVFVSTRSGQSDPWAIDIGGGGPYSLGTTSAEENQIQSNQDGRNTLWETVATTADLVRVAVDDGGTEALTADSRIVIRPSVVMPRGEVFFHRRQPRLDLGAPSVDTEIHRAMLSDTGSTTRAVARGLLATPSPDGRWLAYVEILPPPDPGVHLRILDVSSDESAVVSTDPALPNGSRFPIDWKGATFRWSPHGDELAFVEQTGAEATIHTVRRDDAGGWSRRLRATTSGPVTDLRYAPDGDELAFAHRAGDGFELASIDARPGSVPRSLHVDERAQALYIPGWLSSDEMLVVVEAGDGDDIVATLRRDTDDPWTVRIRGALPAPGNTAWDPVAGALYFLREAGGVFNLWRWSPRQDTPRQVTTISLPWIADSGLSFESPEFVISSRQAIDRDIKLVEMIGEQGR